MGIGMGAGLAISAGAGLLGSIFQSGASSDAASAQVGATQAGQALQYAMYSRTRQDLLSAGQRADDLLKYGGEEAKAALQQGAEQSVMPFMPYYAAGLSGLDKYTEYAMDPSKYKESPAFQWNMEQGLQGINRGRAAAGMLASGGTGYDYATFAQGLASNDYYNQQNQLNSLAQMGLTAGTNISGITGNYYNNLANLATGTAGQRAETGLHGAGSVADLGQNYAANATNLLMAGGQAQAQNTIAQSNIWSNALYNAAQLPLLYAMMGSGGNAGASMYTGFPQGANIGGAVRNMGQLW